VFSGLVTAIGTVRRVAPVAGGLDLAVDAPWDDLAVGESVAVDGACLTVITAGPTGFTAHVVATSLDRTRFATYVDGQRVNLERALRVGDRLGGHLVQGHVDGLGRVTALTPREDAVVVDIAVPPRVARVSVPLGSITVDGVSLTVVEVPAPGTVRVSLVPYTLQATTLGGLGPGALVHVEGDVIGKYVAHLVGRLTPDP
jgi:riboflavin synthase